MVHECAAGEECRSHEELRNTFTHIEMDEEGRQ